MTDLRAIELLTDMAAVYSSGKFTIERSSPTNWRVALADRDGAVGDTLGGAVMALVREMAGRSLSLSERWRRLRKRMVAVPRASDERREING